MLLKEILDTYEIIDSAFVTGNDVKNYLNSIRETDIEVHNIKGKKGSTDFVRITIPGTNGKLNGGDAPTLGILGRLGGIGARPEMIGLVSDADGALVAISIAAKILNMQNKGDFLEGDIIISTHICPNAPTQPHEPVPFMGSPVEMIQVNEEECRGNFDAIISIDTTKGNKIINTRGFAISPTVKEGYILKVSDDLVETMMTTTGKMANVFALSQQDITPYGNDLYHLNSILQPSVATDAPVVGVAITAETAVPGSATGASHPYDLEECARFVLEVAKRYGNSSLEFYDKKEFEMIVSKYGRMNHFQTFGV